MTGLFVKLDVEYPSDDEFIEAGPMAELLFIRGLCFMKRKRTDGKVKRVQLATVAGNIPAAAKHANALVDVGLWEVTQDGWYCPSYLKHNPSKADIATQEMMAREFGERGNHERWHIGPDGKVSPKCRLCRADHVAPPMGSGSGDPIPVGSPDTETEEEPETDAAAESPMAAAAGLVDQALGAALELRRAASHVRNPLTWEPAMRAALRRDHEAAVRVLLTDKGCTPERAARVVLGLEQLPPEAVKQAWYADPFCECGGDGWQTLQDNTTFGPCDCRRSDPYELATVHQLHEEKTA